MFRKIVLLLSAAALVTALPACKKKVTADELQAQKVAAFKQRQKNEAIKAYTELTTKFPESEHAAKAQERLGVLGPMSTPAAKKK